ncbi:MAG TPA: hypothetical protein VKU91_01270 [Acidimicrobiales bacterium]|nr:hypothetical protein [Acidimicrobiales bacterium]
MRRPAAVVVAAAAVWAAAACGSGGAGAAGAHPPVGATTAPPSSTTPATTVPATTTTTAYKPATTQPTPDGAAYQLISAWGDGSRAQAARIASPSAVGSLFAIPYPGSYLQFRGCSSDFSPASCIYRNVNADSIIDVYATRVPGGWYVSSVVVES